MININIVCFNNNINIYIINNNVNNKVIKIIIYFKNNYLHHIIPQSCFGTMFDNFIFIIDIS
jgi:hypothetical protein